MPTPEVLDRTETENPRPHGETPEPGGGPERVTVNLSTLTVAALGSIAQTIGVNKTEAINRALRFYAEITKLIADGGAVYIREPGEKELERVKIY